MTIKQKKMNNFTETQFQSAFQNQEGGKKECVYFCELLYWQRENRRRRRECVKNSKVKERRKRKTAWQTSIVYMRGAYRSVIDVNAHWTISHGLHACVWLLCGLPSNPKSYFSSRDKFQSNYHFIINVRITHLTISRHCVGCESVRCVYTIAVSISIQYQIATNV